MTTNFINVVGKYTLENVKELKDNIPVNEKNVMELTSAYIDENELNLKLNEYATKTFVLSETDPLNEDVNNIKKDLETRPTFDSMQNYTKEYVDEKIGEIGENDNTESITESMNTLNNQIMNLEANKVDVTTFNNHTHSYLEADVLNDINSRFDEQVLDINELREGKLDKATFEQYETQHDESYNDFRTTVFDEQANINARIDEIGNSFANVDHTHDQYSLTTHTHTEFDKITLNKLNECNIAPGINSNGQSPQRPFIPVVDSEGE